MENNFKIGETVILNESAIKGLPDRIGQRATILNILHTSVNYDVDIEFDDAMISPVKYSEINKLTEEDKHLMNYIFTNNKVLYWYDEVTVVKVDYLHTKAEIKFSDGTYDVVDFDKLNPIEVKENNSVKVNQFDIHEDLLNILFKHYRNQDNTYTIPKELLINMLKGLYTDGE
jgi:hypothetical protein